MRHEPQSPCGALLHRELYPALGCTEPVSIAYAAALARETLGAEPESIRVKCSGNIIKNTKSVVVPESGGMRGIPAAAALGAFAGQPGKGLRLLEGAAPAQVAAARAFVAAGRCSLALLPTGHCLHHIVSLSGGGHTALVEICHRHDNVVRRERDGIPLTIREQAEAPSGGPAATPLTMAEILTYVREGDLAEVRPLLAAQIACNLRIAHKGLRERWGMGVGATLLETAAPGDIRARACAAAAAGSDARMNGCCLPVVINAGSGNQGLTVSLPVVEYALHWNCTQEALYRALALSNLVSLHIKARVGRLSAFCGAVSASCGAGAGITLLAGGSDAQICDTITNQLANVAGIICDGAKPSCAAKIASCVDAAVVSHSLAMRGRRFGGGDGIICADVDATIQNIGNLARRGMRETDKVILDLMMAVRST